MSLFLAFAVSLVATVLMIGILIPIAPRLGLIDHPGSRKSHVGTIPLVGGIAIFVGMVLGMLYSGLDSRQVYLLVAGGDA